MLLDILQNPTLQYSSAWKIYAQKINGKFTAESPARIGQAIFDNDGMLDDFDFFSDLEPVVYSRAEYCGEDEYSHEFYKEWAKNYIEEINSSID
ncbi:MAG TPA: hypothetical protein V6D33_13355 [Cyanophyceae cyanobacterium]